MIDNGLQWLYRFVWQMRMAYLRRFGLRAKPPGWILYVPAGKGLIRVDESDVQWQGTIGFAIPSPDKVKFETHWMPIP